jgi:hypothetical protein
VVVEIFWRCSGVYSGRKGTARDRGAIDKELRSTSTSRDRNIALAHTTVSGIFRVGMLMSISVKVFVLLAVLTASLQPRSQAPSSLCSFISIDAVNRTVQQIPFYIS